MYCHSGNSCNFDLVKIQPSRFCLFVMSAITLGQLWDSFGTALEQLWDSFGTALEQLWDSFGTALGQLWDSFGTALEQFWDSFGAALGQLWDSFGTALGQLWDRVYYYHVQCPHDHILALRYQSEPKAHKREVEAGCSYGLPITLKYLWIRYVPYLGACNRKA